MDTNLNTANVPDVIQERFNQIISQVPQCAFEDVFEALSWAKEALTNCEGSGHSFALEAKDNKIRCSFSKPSWASDHTGSYEYEASEAIIKAVCEYLAYAEG
jgi:hypothetical protein